MITIENKRYYNKVKENNFKLNYKNSNNKEKNINII